MKESEEKKDKEAKVENKPTKATPTFQKNQPASTVIDSVNGNCFYQNGHKFDKNHVYIGPDDRKKK